VVEDQLARASWWREILVNQVYLDLVDWRQVILRELLLRMNGNAAGGSWLCDGCGTDGCGTDGGITIGVFATLLLLALLLLWYGAIILGSDDYCCCCTTEGWFLDGQLIRPSLSGGCS